MNKITRFVCLMIASSAAICPFAVTSCSKVPLNETDGSYFYHNNTRVVFQDQGYLLKDADGNLSIACFSGPKVIGEERDCINILVPKDGYTMENNRLTFRNSIEAKVRFFTVGRSLVLVHLRQNARVGVSGTIRNDTAYDFFQSGNAYSFPVTVSFSLDDGNHIRLKMNTVTVDDDPMLIVGW